MNEKVKELKNWLTQLENFSLPSWNDLPDLDLYMDQVVTYLEREMQLLSVEKRERMITSSMVNNYVKGNLIPNPIQKKYSREHISYILEICSAKQILSISDISSLFDIQKRYRENPEDMYEALRDVQARMTKMISKETMDRLDRIRNDASYDDVIGSLSNSAIKFAIEAEVKNIIANKIIYTISLLEEQKIVAAQDKAKKKSKAEKSVTPKIQSPNEKEKE